MRAGRSCPLHYHLEAGFTKQNVLEVILGVSLKTLSNYSNHIAGTPLNQELSSLEWSASA